MADTLTGDEVLAYRSLALNYAKRRCAEFRLTREDAEEIVQDVLLRLSQKYPVRAETVRNLIFTAVRNEIVSCWRRRRRRMACEVLVPIAGSDCVCAADTLRVQQQARRILESAGQLPPHLGRPLLDMYRGVGVDALAIQWGVQPQTIRTRCRRARRLVRQALEQEDWEA